MTPQTPVTVQWGSTCLLGGLNESLQIDSNVQHAHIRLILWVTKLKNIKSLQHRCAY